MDIDGLRYDRDGLVPVVAQDRTTGAVLMLAWATRDALQQSLATGRMTYWSRSRGRLWTKGKESGHGQRVVSLAADCDGDTVLATVEQTGPACHTEAATCFIQAGVTPPCAGFLGELERIIATRAVDAPAASHTAALLRDPAAAAAKVEEEAREVAAVVRGAPNEDTLQHEAADLLYHTLVALRSRGVALEEVLAELRSRHPDAGVVRRGGA